jgi:23S rRNA pseudouridine2605 synthase
VMLHKPSHVVSTSSDPEGRITVLDMIARSRAVGPRQFEGHMPRVYPMGRLDYDAEGLLLLTNDGDMTHAVLHPRRHVPKTYLVRVRGVPTDEALAALRAGVRLRRDDGTFAPRATLPAEARLVKHTRSNSWIELTIFEGRNHQVKRMCEAIDHQVSRLVRTHFAGIALEDLPPGSWRFLTTAEVAFLKSWQETPVPGGVKKPRRAARSPRSNKVQGSAARP